jgi:hypothetical protein
MLAWTPKGFPLLGITPGATGLRDTREELSWAPVPTTAGWISSVAGCRFRKVEVRHGMPELPRDGT